MSYPYPRVTESARGKLTLSTYSAKYGRQDTYGGRLAENITQAVQRDLLAEVIIRLEERYPVAFHVHDEVVSHVKIGYGDFEEFMGIMREVPSWAPGLPIAAEGWRGSRYGKAA